MGIECDLFTNTTINSNPGQAAQIYDGEGKMGIGSDLFTNTTINSNPGEVITQQHRSMLERLRWELDMTYF